jgi:Radical SAM superfamily
MSYKVMQIEVSNLCSLTCAYCPHPDQKRPKGNMTFDTFKACMEVVKRSANPEQEGRKFVWLNHFGEPLLNPLLQEFIAYAVGQGVDVSFATNGVDHDRKFFPREKWAELRDAGLKDVMVSAHVKSVWSMKRHIGKVVRVRGAFQPKGAQLHDWAGQVDISRYSPRYVRNIPKAPCDYETHNMFAIRWDGVLTACCYDIEGRSDGLSVHDVLQQGFVFEPTSLCSGCPLGRGDVWAISPRQPT